MSSAIMVHEKNHFNQHRGSNPLFQSIQIHYNIQFGNNVTAFRKSSNLKMANNIYIWYIIQFLDDGFHFIVELSADDGRLYPIVSQI
jgi:hypothetical protein